jgi:hypothetical protein
MADLSEDKVRSTVRPSVVRFPNDFIPQGAKVVLELGESVAYVKLGKHPQDV